MNLIINLNQYNEDYIFFHDPIKNNIINNGCFIRIIYSIPILSLNGICLLVHIINTSIDKYYKKFIYSFDTRLHKDLIDKIKHIEEGILFKCMIKHKTPQFKIYEQLKCGKIKINSDTMNVTNTMFFLKISGIWETEMEYGLTYKFTDY